MQVTAFVAAVIFWIWALLKITDWMFKPSKTQLLEQKLRRFEDRFTYPFLNNSQTELESYIDSRILRKNENHKKDILSGFEKVAHIVAKLARKEGYVFDPMSDEWVKAPVAKKETKKK